MIELLISIHRNDIGGGRVGSQRRDLLGRLVTFWGRFPFLGGCQRLAHLRFGLIRMFNAGEWQYEGPYRSSWCCCAGRRSHDSVLLIAGQGPARSVVHFRELCLAWPGLDPPRSGSVRCPLRRADLDLGRAEVDGFRIKSQYVANN